ncbi:glycoside hydrolase [Zunongwangia sp. HGR-M22]|uniref:glycoside hydrolase n=1 Tax=Zunongwangia sp. HGR-M22 TaxID=3015168 RepID=UPI0022DD7C71|nr:glycoside hydrolase [Zunongwangia sp. HGR-M22]WBL25318.1 xylanase [Zunongwangia sp. HGR-M22]
MLDTSVTYQTIDNFGASDAWSTQFVGLWPEEKKEKIASLLFSKEVDFEGNPEGIGLSLWRFNLGAGSTNNDNIQDEWRKAESFLQENGGYDWDKQKGQVWFAKKAQEFGVDDFLIFSNSPPVMFTKNQKAYTASGKIANLAEDKFAKYAGFLANSIEGLEKMGLKVDYISPINEPQWDWEDGTQEGTPFWNDQIANLAKSLDSELEKKGIETKIDLAEAAQINYLFEDDNKPGRGSQIYEFFNPDSQNYIGDLSNISQTISGHSYFTTSPESKLINEREALAENLKNYHSLKYWMSEYCILGDNDGEINGNGRDLGIEPALYMAKVIHNDITVAQASAWHWWLAISPYDYKDGLIYIDKNKKGGNFYESKMLWALGNYSRFIRPGSKRIKISVADKSNTLLCSAYLNKNKDEIITVIVNNGAKNELLTLSSANSSMENLKTYTTSSDSNLAFEEVLGSQVEIPKKSIVTIIQNIKS